MKTTENREKYDSHDSDAKRKETFGKGGFMKRVVILSLLLLVPVLMVMPELSGAKVTGVCSNCHTMHFSQNGALDRGGNAQVAGQGTGQCLDCHSNARGVLLKLDCIGCHAENPGGVARISAVTGAPQVAYNEANPANFLAAGNYQRMFSSIAPDPLTGDARGHNVHGFGNELFSDGWLLTNPPGYDANFDPSTLKYNPTFGGGLADPVLMCAGSNGCHGDRDIAGATSAMKGSHHADDLVLKFGTADEATQGSTVGRSYRFLRGVHGVEDSDWQNTKGVGDHNEYKGANNNVASTAGQAWADITTISQLCAECHGAFHARGATGIGNAAAGSPWVRHPTDIALPATGEYSNYTVYNLQAPVARQSVTGLAAASATVTPGSDVVMCLSCHRAHASEYADSLRWDYSAMAAGTGCYVCHTNK